MGLKQIHEQQKSLRSASSRQNTIEKEIRLNEKNQKLNEEIRRLNEKIAMLSKSDLQLQEAQKMQLENEKRKSALDSRENELKEKESETEDTISRYKELIAQAERQKQRQEEAELRAYEIERQAENNKANIDAYARSLFRQDVHAEAEKIARSGNDKLRQALEIQRNNKQEQSKLQEERSALEAEKKYYREQIEDEIWGNYNSDMYSELKKYGKRFIAVAAIICLALCIGVHHSTQAKADKYYKKKIKAKDRQIKVLKEYKENAKESAAANYYQCTKEVSGIIIGDGYGSTVKLQKGEIVREVSQDEDRELVIYSQAGYGNIKVQFNQNKFEKCFTDVDIPID